MKSNRMPLYVTENYQIDLEYNDQYAILHIPFLYLTKSVYQELKVRMEQLWEFIETIGYSGLWAAISPEDRKLKKMMDRFQWKYLGSSDGLDIYQYEGMKN